MLPLLHTLLGQNKLETETFRTDMLAFLSGFKGHITDAMRDFKVNAEQGLQGNEAASNKKHANSLVKVSAATRTTTKSLPDLGSVPQHSVWLALSNYAEGVLRILITGWMWSGQDGTYPCHTSN